MTNESLGGDEIGRLRSELDELRADVERLKAQARAEEVVLGSRPPALPAQRPRLMVLKGGLFAAALVAGFGWLQSHRLGAIALVAGATVAAGALVLLRPDGDAPRAGPDPRPPVVQTPAPSRPSPTPTARPVAEPAAADPQPAEPSGPAVRGVSRPSAIRTAPPAPTETPSLSTQTPKPPEPTVSPPTTEPDPTVPPPGNESCLVRIEVDSVVGCILTVDESSVAGVLYPSGSAT